MVELSYRKAPSNAYQTLSKESGGLKVSVGVCPSLYTTVYSHGHIVTMPPLPERTLGCSRLQYRGEAKATMSVFSNSAHIPTNLVLDILAHTTMQSDS